MTTYLFGEKELSCVSLEKAAGLPAGKIKQLTVCPDGSVEVECDGLTKSQQAAVKTALGKLGLIRDMYVK